LACGYALAACTGQPATSGPDPSVQSEEIGSGNPQPSPSVLPFLPSLPEQSDELPPPGLLPAGSSARTYDLHPASKSYSFRLEVGGARPRKGEDPAGPPAKLTVFRKGTGQVVQHLRIPSLAARALDPDYEPPLLVQDFNFDGHEDIAVHTGDSGPYGAATYGVYLYSSASRTFVHAPALSRLTEESIAPMRADASRRRLVIASKSGCCIHWSEEYDVRGDLPILMKRETEELGADDVCLLTVEERQQGGVLRRKKRACR
jgi:hypothetical protein